jgi:hypothetical protein
VLRIRLFDRRFEDSEAASLTLRPFDRLMAPRKIEGGLRVTLSIVEG